MTSVVNPEVVFEELVSSLEKAKSELRSVIVSTVITDGVDNWEEIVGPYFEASVYLEKSIMTLQSASNKEGSTV